MLNEMQKEVYEIIKKRYIHNDIIVDSIISNVVETIIKNYSNEECLKIIVNSTYQVNIDDYYSQKL